MSVLACPIAIVNAPLTQVWDLVTTSRGFDRWVDARVVTAEPPGPAAPGQILGLRTRGFGLNWRIGFTVGEVVPMSSVQITVNLPFGIVNHERISLFPISGRETRVTLN